MKKSLQLQVDRSSWSRVAQAYRKPCPFVTSQNEARVDFLRSLLWVGITSVSIRMPRWWLASQWAILRYIAAADHTTRMLRLHTAAEDLDSHHKKVLSDDWGVGLSLQWLATQMQYKYVVHGASAMQLLQSTGIAQFVRRKKTGPHKCPDFFAVDTQNRIHLIECKGNQEGASHIDKQFERGRQQKQNVRFRNEALVAQRLLTGIAIAGASSNWVSTLKVADPPPDGSFSYYNVGAETALPLIDAFKRVIVMQGLILAGALKIAHRLFPEETETADVRSITEPRAVHFEAQGERWTGLVYELSFPIPIELHDRTRISACRMRFGAGEGSLDELNAQETPSRVEEIIKRTEVGLQSEGEPERSKEELSENGGANISRRATIQQGKEFLSDLELLEE